MTLTAITNARLIDPANGLDTQGDLLIDGQNIAAIGTFDLPDAVQVIDAKGKILSPGLIDLMVATGEPGLEHKETLRSASWAAAAGGVTTMVHMPDGPDPIDNPTLVDFIRRRAAETAKVRVLPMATITKEIQGLAMAEMGMNAHTGAIGFTDGTRAIQDSGVLRRALAYAANVGRPIHLFPEDQGLAGNGVMHEGEMSTRYGLTGHPPAAELIGLERDIRLIELTGAPATLGPISTAQGVEIIAKAKAQGLPIKAMVAISNLTLNNMDIGEYRTFFKVKPPLRTEEDRLALIEGVKSGVIDYVTSNHRPEDQEAKRQPFAQASWGAIGVETLLPALLELVHNGSLDLITALKAVTTNPADLLGLPQGRLEVGAPADLVVIDLNKPFVLDASTLLSKSKNTPYEDRRLQGLAMRTIVGGTTVFDREG